LAKQTSGMNERRRFSKRQKDALFLASDGRSEASGEPLQDGWHADHVFPWALGGDTDVMNGQALNPEENLAKGASHLALRAWQEEFVERYQSSSARDFLLCALPGGGKTVAALHVARQFLSAGRDRKVIVIVPTRYLKKQWRDDAYARFQINLQTEEFRGTLKPAVDGVAITYAAAARNPDLFRRLCVIHECFVIFDEIHHAGEQASWGEAIQDAFEPAKQRLCLSGTPFRSDGKKIPFLTLKPDGTYEVHYQYDYPRALRDDVVRSVSFHRYSGSVTVAQCGAVWDFHTDDDLDESDAGKRLRGLLHHPTFTGGLLAKSHQKLMEIRQLHPDAGGLAVCMNQTHAQSVARLLHEITGELPDIIVSDEDMNTGSIDEFRKSNKQWLVAVRMVSEGVDIKRLMVLSYLTNVKTPMSFRQTIGRIVRRAREDDIESYCVMPDDRDLSEMAKAIEEVQFQVIREDEEDELREKRQASDRDNEYGDLMVLDSSEPQLAGTTTTGRSYDATRATQIIVMASKHGIAESKMAAIWEELFPAARPEPVFADGAIVHPEDELKGLRTKAQKLAQRVAYKGGVEFKEIHIRYKKEVDGTDPKMMTKDQLERKLQWLNQQLAMTTLI
jgi:superfamily II DNA or RNA helicase